MEDTALFRSISARITAASIFMVLAIMILYEQLPYQLPLNPNKASTIKIILQVIAIVATCSLILFFFIPTKKMAVYTLIWMLFLYFSYAATKAIYHQNWILWVVIIPFCRGDEGMCSQIKFQRILPPMFLILSVFNHGKMVFESISILLYLIPYIPFQAISKWIVTQLEPR